MSTEAKVKIYKTTIRPVITYAAETRAETRKTKQTMTTTEMNSLRAIVGKTRFDRVPNTEIRNQCDIQDISKWVKTRRKAWNEHVDRASPDRLIKSIRDQRIHGVRDRGRPPKRWKDSWLTSSADSPP